MDLVQQRTIGRQIRTARPTYITVSVLTAAAIIALVAATIVLRMLTASAPAAAGVGSPEWREFRAGERSVTAPADPLLAPAIIEFRRDERAVAGGR
jgi:hypothetical protein